jgi:AraC-like DNA-binding protein
MMENEFHSGISVEEIADRLHLNRSHFSVTFKRGTGRSPREYLISLRMKKAAEWLCEGGLSVSVTAASVGYPDVFAFSRAFKNYYGVSPTEYTKTNID